VQLPPRSRHYASGHLTRSPGWHAARACPAGAVQPSAASPPVAAGRDGHAQDAEGAEPPRTADAGRPRTRPRASGLLLAGRVHGDAVFQLDDFTTAAGGGAPGPFGENPSGCRAPGLRPRSRAGGLAAARLWGLCGDLENDTWCPRHATSLSSCVSAGKRAGLVACPRWAVLDLNQ
jgi:hypothetical protein